MAQYRYETHKMPDPLLPFIYHPRFEVCHRDKYPNWHENIELLQAIEGTGYIRCGAECFPFSKGDLFIVNADTLHSIGTDGQLVYRCLIVGNSFFISNGIPIASLYFQNTIRDAGLYRTFENIAQAYVNYDSTDFRTVLAIRTEVLHLLLALCKSYISTQPPLPSNEHIKAAMTYIRKNLSAPLSLDNIADHVGVSKFHLSRQFKLFTGKTIVQTINLMRCTEAQRLIESGMQVGEAATACGFDNLSYFTRTFKILIGKLPSQYSSS